MTAVGLAVVPGRWDRASRSHARSSGFASRKLLTTTQAGAGAPEFAAKWPPGGDEPVRRDGVTLEADPALPHPRNGSMRSSPVDLIRNTPQP